MTEDELEKLAATIAARVWRRIRREVKRQQREIFDEEDE